MTRLCASPQAARTPCGSWNSYAPPGPQHQARGAGGTSGAAAFDKVGFDAGTELLKLVGIEFRTTQCGRQAQREMVVTGSARANLGGKIDRQGADNRVTRSNLLRVEMGELPINGDALPLCPGDGTRVAGDEPDSHVKARLNQ
jgi:hypothetical protein